MDLTVEQFIKHLVKGGLMTADEVDRFQAALPEDRRPNTARELVRELIGAKKLTSFQAKLIWHGHADRLSVAGLARAIRDTSARARDGKLRLQDVQGGTFTVDNTGALGSVVSVPIINHPQAAIITTEAVVKRPVVAEGDAIVVRSMMNLCLTFDHRVCDGAEAARFLNGVKSRIEAIDERTTLS